MQPPEEDSRVEEDVMSDDGWSFDADGGPTPFLGREELELIWAMSRVLEWLLPSAPFGCPQDVQDVYIVICGFYQVGCWSMATNVGGVILVMRTIAAITERGLTVDVPKLTWDALLTVSMMVAQKILDDVPLANDQFPTLRRVVVPHSEDSQFPALSLQDINKFEVWLLQTLEFSIELPNKTMQDFHRELSQLRAAEGVLPEVVVPVFPVAGFSGPVSEGEESHATEAAAVETETSIFGF